MHKVTVYPLGNADSILIDLKSGKKLLFDYANMRNASDPNDKRIDLPTTLRANLKAERRDSFDVVAISHLDDDHVHGASEFFHLRHASKYQGEGRIKIDELWVPAAVIVEDACKDEARIIQAEARYRFKQGTGIRVFSGPNTLAAWMGKEEIPAESRKSLITNAGELVPGYNDKTTHGVEFFVHSPFAHRQNANRQVERNDDCLVIQATFHSPGYLGGRDTKVILSADVTHEVLSEMVRITKIKGNQERLEWDIFKLPHHCSYLSLGPEKGKEKTEPVEEVKWLFEEQGQEKGKIISTSWEIPTTDTDQPPHRQAANYHRGRATALIGDFLVTMEHPSKSKPEPLVIKIDNCGATLEKSTAGGASAIVSAPAPRAGTD